MTKFCEKLPSMLLANRICRSNKNKDMDSRIEMLCLLNLQSWVRNCLILLTQAIAFASKVFAVFTEFTIVWYVLVIIILTPVIAFASSFCCVY